MLGRHQIYRRLAPWVMENPLQLHLTNSTPAAFELALDQMHEVGFEALWFSRLEAGLSLKWRRTTHTLPR
jgi:hypothetical protein